MEDKEVEELMYIFLNFDKRDWNSHLRTSVIERITKPLKEKYGENWKPEEHKKELSEEINNYLNDMWM